MQKQQSVAFTFETPKSILHPTLSVLQIIQTSLHNFQGIFIGSDLIMESSNALPNTHYMGLHFIRYKRDA